jgi:dienelactone hydrolase
MRLGFLAVVLAALAQAACSTYATLDQRAAMLAPAMEYHAPAGGGAAPLVIFASGCGGLNGLQGAKTIMKNYAAAATAAGAYVAVFDSFAPRDIGFEESVAWVCSGMRLRGDARAADIIAAEALARQHWNTRFTGVILAGWSHGGWSVMELLSAGPDANHVGNFHIKAPAGSLSPDAVALYYPYCGLLNSAGRSRWSFDGPLFLLTADADSPGAGKTCSDAIAHARGNLDGVEAYHFASNTHAFDEDDQVPGSVFTYDPEATRTSLNLFEAFIRKQVERLNTPAP